MHKPKIVVVGSINMDLLATVDRFPVPGETVRSKSFTTVPGGKGANQAAAAALAGAQVTMVGRVGKDIFGDSCLENLKSKGVDIQFIKRDEQEPTGNAMISVDTEGQNELIYTAGANNRVTVQDAKDAKDAIQAADMIILQFELPMETVSGVVSLASELGTRIIVNPAPADTPTEGLLKKIDYFVPNESEAKQLTGLHVVDTDTAAEAAKELFNRGTKHVIVTMGPQGAVIYDTNGLLRVPTRQVKAVDVTAAGDSFIGALAVALSSDRDLPDAVDFACSAATLSVTKLGAQPSIPTREEIDRYRKQ